jgi:hypothetical protein
MNSFIGITIGVISGVTGGSLAYMYYKETKVSKPVEIPKTKWVSVLNLTSQTVNIYDDNNNYLFGITPHDKSMQLSLVSTTDSESTEKKNPDQVFLRSYEFEFDDEKIKQRKSNCKGASTWNYGDGEIVECFVNTRTRTFNDKVLGFEQLEKKMKVDGWANVINSILVDKAVAEHLIAHNKKKDTKRDLNLNIYVPDTDPKSIIRDEKGEIIGVKGVVNYGTIKI